MLTDLEKYEFVEFFSFSTSLCGLGLYYFASPFSLSPTSHPPPPKKPKNKANPPKPPKLQGLPCWMKWKFLSLSFKTLHIPAPNTFSILSPRIPFCAPPL